MVIGGDIPESPGYIPGLDQKVRGDIQETIMTAHMSTVWGDIQETIMTAHMSTVW